jgi:hypothetical protein
MSEAILSAGADRSKPPIAIATGIDDFDRDDLLRELLAALLAPGCTVAAVLAWLSIPPDL